MLWSDILREAVIDFDPEVDRTLFDLNVKASHGPLPEKERRAFSSWLNQHKNDELCLYHGTSIKHPVMMQGLLPTSAKRAKSLQSGRGNVYLAFEPMRALSFAMMAYVGQPVLAVYRVTMPIRLLKADPDNLRNKRMWGSDHQTIGSTLADSLIYGGGAMVKGQVEPYRISLFGYFDRSHHRVEAPV